MLASLTALLSIAHTATFSFRWAVAPIRDLAGAAEDAGFGAAGGATGDTTV
jgi:hypothetical protein